jgi:predicted Zn-dependent peptidase
LAYTATTHPGHVRDVAEILADVLRPRLAEWEFREVKELVKDDIEQRKSNLIATLGDKVRHTAFRGVGLGRAPVIPEYNLDQIYPEQLADWIGSNVIGERITLVIAGNTPYDDEGLIKSLAVIFAALPASSIGSGPAAPVVASNYYGGELVEAGGPSNIYVEAYKGAQAGSKDHVAQLVLANILGDATSEFLPGNNLTSRFAKEFSGDEFSLVSSFNSHDSQTLFGVRAVGSAPTKVLAEKVHSQLSNLATNKITEEELNRSRNILKTRLKLFRDSRNGFLLGTWKYGNGSAFDGALDALTPQSLQQVASNLLSTPRTTVVKGDLTDLPSFK